jgi:hypothetical protein
MVTFRCKTLKPSDDSPNPGTIMTSLFQRNLVAIRTELEFNWRAESGACGIFTADSPA